MPIRRRWPQWQAPTLNETRGGSVRAGDISESDDQLKRHLDNRQIQLIAIGMSIGTATFASISNGLVAGGPDSLFLAYTIYSFVMALDNNYMAEVVVFYPTTGAFIRMAGKWVDEFLGSMAGWNFFYLRSSFYSFRNFGLDAGLFILA
ncbi:amino acid permease [Seiridium cupressi]